MANRKPQRLNEIIASYRMVFGGEDGLAVLADLAARFHASSPTFVAGDPHESAYLEGQRSVVLTIQHMISDEREPLGDADDE